MTAPAASEPGGATASDRIERQAGLPFVACLAVGAALRFALLAHQSFWYDEVVSVLLARSPLRELASGHAHDLGNPPLYPMLLHLWRLVFGSSDAAVRALSATTSTASIPLVYLIGRRLVGLPAALVATAIFSVSPVQIYFAQEARTYTLVSLLCLAATACLLRALRGGRGPGATAAWAGYAATVFLALYAHYYAAFVVIAHVVWLLLAHRRAAVLVRAAGALIAAGALYAVVWLPSLVGQATTKGNLGRAVDTWYLHVLSTPMVFGAGTTLLWKGTVTPLRLVGGGVALVAFGALALYGAFRLRRDRESGWLLVIWLLMPVLLPTLVSLALFPFYYVRYALVAAPAYYLLVAVGVTSVGRRLRPVAVGALAGTSLLSLAFYFTTLVKHDWRSAVTWAEANARPGDVVVFDADIGETTFAYYGGPDRARIRLLPPPDPSAEDRYWGTSPAKEPAHAVAATLASAKRVWFVYSDPQSGTGDYYQTLLEREWRRTGGRKFRGIDLEILERP